MATTWTDALLDQLSEEGDDPVDAVIAAHAELVPGASTDPRQLVRSVARHLVLAPEQSSPPLAAYLAERPPLPDWADRDLMRRSADFFTENGLLVGASLFCASLPESYAAPRGAKVLALTGRLATDPVRRVYETAQMILDSMTRGGLEPGGRGYDATRRVRLMHSAVRFLVGHDPDVAHVDQRPVPQQAWFDPWGMPLNQEDLFGGLLTFTISTFETLDKLGTPVEREQAEAYLHAWSVVGHLLGLRPDLLPIDLTGAQQLSAMIRRRQQGPTEDGVLLTGALRQALEGGLWPGFRGLVPATMRWFVGPEVAGYVEIPRSGWAWVLEGPVRSIGRDVQAGIRHDRFLSWLTKRWNRRIFRHFMDVNRAGDRPTFAIPSELHPTFQVKRRSFRFG